MTKLYLALSTLITANPYAKQDDNHTLYETKYSLVSFYYINVLNNLDIKKMPNILLDSGAFSFLNGKEIKKETLEGFVEKYIKYINENNIKYFFEMDVDSLFGYDYVKELRNKIEKETGKKTIPVWHKSRGLDEFIKLCQEYNYIAIGGIVTKEIKRSEYDVLIKLNTLAKKYNCKVHGLGFTPSKDIEKYGFYSCDSSTWASGNRFKGIYFFNNGRMSKYQGKSSFLENKKIINHYKLAFHNFCEWKKYQEYLEKEDEK